MSQDLTLRQFLEVLAAQGHDLSDFGAIAMQDPDFKEFRDNFEHPNCDCETWLQNFANYVQKYIDRWAKEGNLPSHCLPEE